MSFIKFNKMLEDGGILVLNDFIHGEGYISSLEQMIHSLNKRIDNLFLTSLDQSGITNCSLVRYFGILLRNDKKYDVLTLCEFNSASPEVKNIIRDNLDAFRKAYKLTIILCKANTQLAADYTRSINDIFI